MPLIYKNQLKNKGINILCFKQKFKYLCEKKYLVKVEILILLFKILAKKVKSKIKK